MLRPWNKTRGQADKIVSALTLIDHLGQYGSNRKAVLKGTLLSGLASQQPQAYEGIPTMVTPRELRMLDHFFAITSMKGPVLEIGCYLGGSTAAIGTGLAQQTFKHRFYTIDAFHWDEPSFRNMHLLPDIERLGGEKSLGAEIMADGNKGEWLRLFHHIHKNKKYSRFLAPVRYMLPSGSQPFQLPAPIPTDAVFSGIFIDGFKSWGVTYTAMLGLLPHVRQGTFLIFQDFSWFDCYWLPILAEYWAGGAHQLMRVDNTVIFEVTNPSALLAAVKTFGPKPQQGQAHAYFDVLRRHATIQFHSGDEISFTNHLAQEYVFAHQMEMKDHAAATFALLSPLCEHLGMQWLKNELVTRSTFVIPAS